MRADQFVRLQELSEELTDVAIGELDHKQWPGANVPLAEHDAKMRGDRYWFKKNAIATLGVVNRIDSLVGTIQMRSNAGNAPSTAAVTDGDADLDNEIKAAEKAGKEMLEKIMNMDKSKANFDKVVHGK